jgi:LPS-assembly lipoprotein
MFAALQSSIGSKHRLNQYAVVSMYKSLSVKLISALFISSILAGCGFHFRGDYFVPENIGTLSVTSFDQYSPLVRRINTELRLNGIEVVTPAANTPNLHLASESVSERTLSLYQNSRAAEKELTYVANYRVTIPNEGATSFSAKVTRSFLDNPLTVLAKSVERDQIEDEMRGQAAQQIIRQLARLKESEEFTSPYKKVEVDFDDDSEPSLATP